MITEVRLQNVRIYDRGEWKFPLSDLTILCGTNSAGKSTVLKCLLLLRQNLLLRDPASSAGTSPRLRFSGGFTDLGNFRSLVSHNDTARDLHLGVSITSAMTSENFAYLNPDLAYIWDPVRNEAGRRQTEYIDYQLDADFDFGTRQSFVALDAQKPDKQLDLRIEETDDDSAAEHRALLKAARFCIRSADGEIWVTFEVVRRASSPKSNQPGYFLRIPKRLFAWYRELMSLEYMDDSDPEFGLARVSMPGLYPERILAEPRAAGSVPDETSQRFFPLPPYMDEAFADLRSAVNRIVYLGPLRAPAKRYYPIMSEPNALSDVTGESLPLLLRDRSNMQVVSAMPQTHTVLRTRLVETLNTWLYFMRTGKEQQPYYGEREIRIDSMQDVLVELGIRSVGGKEMHALADSGFGYSQILPILVRGLMLPAGGTLVVEQPEVHLNPALQVRLSDFIVAMAACNKQIIIETHSEHIVNAIRAIAAEEQGTSVSGGCTVLYLEAIDGSPKLHQLSLKEDGSVPDWPQSFFGEAAQLFGRILRAQKIH